MTLKQYIVAGVIEQVIMLGFILPAPGKFLPKDPFLVNVLFV